MSDIFLSYNREDQEVADLFVRAFEAAGIPVWWDASLRAGEVYDEVTEDALRQAKAVIVLWSARSVKSRWVRAEATLAQRAGTFVPCMIEPCDRPIMFELTQTADLIGWRGEQQDPRWQAFLRHVRDEVLRRARQAGAPSPSAAAPAPAPVPAPAERPAVRKLAGGASERRLITFLAAELANGRELASRLDPEDWHDLVTRLRPAFDPVIVELGGTARWTGHGVSAIFGYPVAHEDAAQRAIQAGLALVERVRGLADPAIAAEAAALAFKVGVHTSDVLVTASDGGDPELFGDGAAVAAQARDAAGAGAIMVSEAARQLVAGAFRLAPAPQADGTLFHLVEGPAAAGRTARGWSAGAGTPFVGREEELALLRGRWKRALAGSSQEVLVRGDPGIGKTRLIDEFRAGLAGQDHLWITLQGASMFPNTPYYAIGQMLGQLAEDAGEDWSGVLRRLVSELGLSTDLPALLEPMVGNRADGSRAAPTHDHQRAYLLGGLIQALFDLARSRPLVMLIDDLQWIDPSTLEIVQMVIEQADADRILVIGTARPEFRPPWSEHERHSRINLGRLSQDEVRDLVAGAIGPERADAATVASLLDRADGVPLFAEELARMVASEPAASAPASLPPTLRGLLAARMDRLGASRELLQIAAVLGRSFSHDLLREVAARGEEELARQVAELTEEQLLFARGAPPAAVYRFKHALVQDAAYDTLPKRRQRQLHELAARTIVERFPDLAEAQGELVATHWTRAGLAEEAAAAWLAAGSGAFSRAACKEVVAHCRSGLAAIAQAPEGAARDRAELGLWSLLNRALQQVAGYSDPQTVEAAAKAIALARKSGSLTSIMVEEAQLWRAAITAGDYERADTIAQQVLELGAELHGAERPAWLDYFYTNARVQTDFYAGRIKAFEDDYARLQQTLADARLTHSATDDVVSIGVAALAAWMAGRNDLADRRMAEGIALAEGSRHPYAVAVAFHFAGTLSAFEDDRATTRAHSERAVKVSEENGFEYILDLARVKLGWTSALGHADEGDIAAMRDAVRKLMTSNARVGMLMVLNRLAIALEGHGRLDEALAVAGEALAANPQERVALPQTLEIRGRLRERAGQPGEAEADYRAAVGLAAGMGALALELSAVLHLARLLAGQGNRCAALAALEETIARCDAQTTSPDLPRARALLAELGNAAAA